ncbi:hypothetical protein NY78_3729 [Desulfovibrio sp. TomC]|nr:hypothetical protein NY78_3729 [Desulfovibrio sp. TomC]
MQKRIADFLEKMSVGFLVGAFFQGSWAAMFFSAVAIATSLHLTKRMEQ